MNNVDIEKKCPRCGYVDTGKYCSNCSYPLDREVTSVYKEIYHSFFSKYFHEKPVLRFMRTWWRAFVKPGSINYKESFKADSKYMNDIQFAKTIFFLALGTTILKMFVKSDDQIEHLIMNWLFQTYVLWIFCFTLLSFIWSGRFWKRLMRMNVDDQRSFDSVFIYEYGFILTIVYVLSLIYGKEIKEFGEAVVSPEATLRIPSELKSAGIVLLIIFAVHFFLLKISIGIRTGLPVIRMVFVSILSIYLLIFFMAAAEIVTVIVVLFPVASPFYYLGRNILRKIKSLTTREVATQ